MRFQAELVTSKANTAKVRALETANTKLQSQLTTSQRQFVQISSDLTVSNTKLITSTNRLEKAEAESTNFKQMADQLKAECSGMWVVKQELEVVKRNLSETNTNLEYQKKMHTLLAKENDELRQKVSSFLFIKHIIVF